eukprot:338134_1
MDNSACTDNKYSHVHKGSQCAIYHPKNKQIQHKCRKNLIIWDFDDTIFPTYAFKTHTNKTDTKFIPKLMILATIIEHIFNQMIKLYGAQNICIVTNGKKNWIHKCLNVDIVHGIFVNFQNVLKKHNIQTISASTKEMQIKYPQNYYKWKQVTFSELFKGYFDEKSETSINCITSIGDSLCEYKASDVSSKYLKNRVLNRIRFKPNPSITEMIFELQQISTIIDAFGISSNDIEMDFSTIM